MGVGTTNEMTFLETAYVPSLHDTLVIFFILGGLYLRTQVTRHLYGQLWGTLPWICRLIACPDEEL